MRSISETANVMALMASTAEALARHQRLSGHRLTSDECDFIITAKAPSKRQKRRARGKTTEGAS